MTRNQTSILNLCFHFFKFCHHYPANGHKDMRSLGGGGKRPAFSPCNRFLISCHLTTAHSYKVFVGIDCAFCLCLHRWDSRMSAIIPGEDTFYLVALLRFSPPYPSGPPIQSILAQNEQILHYCTTAGIDMKLYLPHYKTESDWKRHFGRKWQQFLQRKSTYDPKAILAPGQRIFSRSTDATAFTRLYSSSWRPLLPTNIFPKIQSRFHYPLYSPEPHLFSFTQTIHYSVLDFLFFGSAIQTFSRMDGCYIQTGIFHMTFSCMELSCWLCCNYCFKVGLCWNIHHRFPRKVMLQANWILAAAGRCSREWWEGSMQISTIGQLPPTHCWIPRGTEATTY